MSAHVLSLERDGPTQLCLELVFGSKAPVLKFPRRNKAVVVPPENQEWSADAISCLREAVLMDTLRNLTDGRATTAKEEAMEWMMSDEVHPFSFRICANEMGMDHVEIRNRVLRMIDSIERKLAGCKARHKEIPND